MLLPSSTDETEGELASQAPPQDLDIDETEGELGTQVPPQDLDIDETEGELDTQAPPLPRTTPPLTRARARTLDHVALAPGLFGNKSSPVPILTMLQVTSEATPRPTKDPCRPTPTLAMNHNNLPLNPNQP